MAKIIEHEFTVTRAKEFDNGNISFDMTVDGYVKIYGCTVVDGKDGQFISFPARKGKDGKWYSHCWCGISESETKEIIKQIKKKL